MSILNESVEVAPRGAAITILLDADYLAYMIGGISQGKDRDENTTGQEHVCIDPDADTWVWIDPVALVHWRVDHEIEKLKDTFGSDNLEAWLTPHEGNFRFDIAVTKPYKNRSGVRPFWYQEVRDYLVLTHGAQVANGCEADDMVCTRQMDHFLAKEESVIVGPDKDLRCMFGKHYDPRKDIHSWVCWQQAAINFYGQMITGDSVDSIPGCKGRGPKFWEAMSKPYIGETRRLLTIDIDNLHFQVLDAYYNKGHSEDYVLEQANLLHMRRRLGEEWHLEYNWEEGYC